MQTVIGIIAVVVGVILAFKILILLAHVVGFLLMVAATVIWVGALLHIVFSQFSSMGVKVLWFLVVFFTHVIGAIVYFLFGRPRGVVRTYIS